MSDNQKLSARELEILRLVEIGLANKEIAHELGIAFNTVRTHLSSAFRKLGVSSRTAAVHKLKCEPWRAGRGLE